MLNENIKQLRKNLGLSQQEFALRLNVVRQTVSKWEKGISVSDAEIVQRISELYGIPVQSLLGSDNISNSNIDEISKTLAKINEQLAIRNHAAANIWRNFCIILAIILAFILGQMVIGYQSGEIIKPDTIPEIIIESVDFEISNGTITCVFIPKTENKKISYSVIAHIMSESENSDVIAETREENGIYSSNFKMTDLNFNTVDNFIIKAEYKNRVINIVAAKNFSYSSNASAYTYTSVLE